MRSRLFGFVLAGLALFAMTGSARASHYPTEVVPFISDADRVALEANGISDTRQMLDAMLSPAARRKLSKKTGVAVESLDKYAGLCDLLRVRGIGPKMAEVLYLADVKNIEALKTQKPPELAEKMKKTNFSLPKPISDILPDERTLQDWIDQANQLEIIVR